MTEQTLDASTRRKAMIEAAVICLAMMFAGAGVGGGIGYKLGQSHAPVVKPAPPQPPPLALAAKEYVGTMAATFQSTADAVKAAKIADKAGLISALQEHAKPLANQLRTTFDPLCDSNGKIVNPAAAADVLSQTAKALGGK